MKKLIPFLFILNFSVWAEETCRLPKDEKLIIGCTYHCGFFYKYRLKTSARKLGYKIQIVDLRDYSSMEEGLSKVDAVLIPGGADIHPKYYWDKVTPELKSYTQNNLTWFNPSDEGEKRDPFEYELLQKYSSENRYEKLPLLGICRGMQMMSVAQGIPLYLDINQELGIKNRYNKIDRIYVGEVPSLMDQLFPKGIFYGFKYHHQGIRMNYYEEHQDNYTNTRVTAYSHDQKIAEALEYQHRKALGVQFHPEKSLPKVKHKIFSWLLKRSCEYKKSTKRSL